MVKIKVCGLRCQADAKEAVRLKADFIGFVFAKSPRQVTPEKVSQIVQELPPGVAKIGVFVNEEFETLSQIVDYCGLDFVQLHGDEAPSYCQKLKKRSNVKIIKAIRVKGLETFKEIDDYQVDYFLLDTFNKDSYGGCGRAFDWTLIKQAIIKLPVFLAGGLNSANVLEAIDIVNPFAVDVSSGIETNGLKDFEKMKHFIETVRGVNYVA